MPVFYRLSAQLVQNYLSKKSSSSRLHCPIPLTFSIICRESDSDLSIRKLEPFKSFIRKPYNTISMKTVLVIDDDELTCSILRKLIERHDAEAITASGGLATERILKDQKRFDLILLDLILPCSSGWDLLDLIKNTPASKDTPVVIMTAADISAKEREKLQTKVAAIVDKSTFDTDKFGEILNQLL